jgi:hypothetical protein
MSLCGEWYPKYFTSFLGLFILALFDDKTNWFLHMSGVLVMLIGALYIVLISNDMWPRLILFASSLILYLARIITKVFIVATLESKTYSLNDIFTKSIDIMYYGATVCIYPQYTIPIFRVAGILQWVVFYLILVSIE